MLHKLSTFRRGHSPLHRFDKTRLMLQVIPKHFLRQLPGIPPFTHGHLRELGFLFRRQMYFHIASLGIPAASVNADPTPSLQPIQPRPRHLEGSRPTLFFTFAPANVSACEERNLSSSSFSYQSLNTRHFP